MNTPLDIGQVNTLPREAFVQLFGGIYEHSPWVAEKAGASRPFDSRDALTAAMQEAVDRCSPDERREILCAHPQLSGKEARQGALTASSRQEQARLSLDALTGPELDAMVDINRRFVEKFGFPAIVAVRLHDSVGSVIAELERRLDSDHESEFNEAMGQVHHIARFRLGDLVAEDPGPAA